MKPKEKELFYMRTKTLSIRFTEKEYEYIREQAYKTHCSMGQYIRFMIFKEVENYNE